MHVMWSLQDVVSLILTYIYSQYRFIGSVAFQKYVRKAMASGNFKLLLKIHFEQIFHINISSKQGRRSESNCYLAFSMKYDTNYFATEICVGIQTLYSLPTEYDSPCRLSLTLCNSVSISQKLGVYTIVIF